jgi:hypothetical protein
VELVNQVTTESPLRENEEDSVKLSTLVSQVDVLNLLADEKWLSVDEKEARDVIRSTKEHCL